MTVYSASVTAPVNIATLKYWGKRDKSLNLPTNSSISVTLSQDDLRTLTSAACSSDFEQDTMWLNGKRESLGSERTQACLSDLRRLRKVKEDFDSSLPKLSSFPLHIVSENNFPTAAGLASSAAGFAALVMAIATLYQVDDDRSELSKIARKGSGSACRSVFGGFVAWEMGSKDDGSDSRAVEVAPLQHWPEIKAAILVVSDDKKDTPSTSGMQQTVATSDLFKERVETVVPKRYDDMTKSILDKNFPVFADLTMKDSNSFHAVCLDSYPPIFYLNDTSKKVMKLIHQLNASEKETIAAYTFDAGPNAVIYYEEKNELKVLGLLNKYLNGKDGWKLVDTKDLATKFEGFPEFDISAGVSRVILTRAGDGPQISPESLIDEGGNPKFAV